MIHETRVVPLDGRPHVRLRTSRCGMGDSRGHWEGNTLVVETTNFTDRTGVGVNGGGHAISDALKITERFTRVDADTARLRDDRRRSEDLDAPVDDAVPAASATTATACSSTPATRATTRCSTS